MEPEKIKKLRILITENLHVQLGGAAPVSYIDVANVLSDAAARQNHAIFGRRGCGKTLLLHHSAKTLPENIKPIYLNCEDFKKHSFPNVLIEILDALFGELEKNLTGWFGRKKRSRELVADIRRQLHNLRQRQDRHPPQLRNSSGFMLGSCR
jgi:predicted AAA+ superfamily ATPase